MAPLWIAGLGYQEIFLIAFLIFIFFGARKLPELGKGLGKGIRNFKSSISGDEEKQIEGGEEESSRDRSSNQH